MWSSLEVFPPAGPPSRANLGLFRGKIKDRSSARPREISPPLTTFDIAERFLDDSASPNIILFLRRHRMTLFQASFDTLLALPPLPRAFLLLRSLLPLPDSIFSYIPTSLGGERSLLSSFDTVT